jgi:hypothetical protein
VRVEGDTPFVSVQIEGRKYSMLFDTGSHLNGLRKECMNRVVSKSYAHETSTIDLKGVGRKERIFGFAAMGLGSLQIMNCGISEISDLSDLAGVSLCEETFIAPAWLQQCNGILGYTIVPNGAYFLDFGGREIILAKDAKQLLKFFTDDYVAIPFLANDERAIIPVDTNLGVMRFGFDTGASISVVRSRLIADEHITLRYLGRPSMMTLSKFVIGTIDCGPFDLWMYDIAEEIDRIDGLIGFDFFLKHKVCLDFAGKVAYIEKGTACNSSVD